jgi:hypothetical protein
MKTVNSSIGQTRRYLTLEEAKMKKDKLLESGVTMDLLLKSGKFCMLIKLIKIELRASTRSSDFISTDHSTSDQDFHSKELLNAMVPTMSGSRDGEIMLEINNGTSMKFQRPSRTTTGNHTHLTSNQMVTAATSDVLLLTQDGGNYSDTKDLKSSTREERFLKFKVELMLKTETSWLIAKTTKLSTNNGISSMLINGRENQLRDNSIRDSVSTLREISTLSQNFQTTDTLISSTTETWSSRFQTAEEPKSGTSTNNL